MRELQTAFLGRVLMFVFRKFWYTNVDRYTIKQFEQLVGCDLCLGVWVYAFICLIFDVDLTTGISRKSSFLGKLFTGMVISFLAWVFGNGWQTLFAEVRLE